MWGLLQEYYFLPLDIFQHFMENKHIETDVEAWLAFLSFVDPIRIEELITKFPNFKALYQEIYELCLNTEKVMNLYSKELQILDQNTVRYMIDELQEQVDKDKVIIAQKDQEIAALKAQISDLQK